MQKDINSLDELIHDPSFINWVLQSDPADVQHWQEWLEQNPEKIPLAEEAALLVKGISFRKKQLPHTAIAQSWITVQTIIQEKSKKKYRFDTVTLRWAASLSLLLIGAVILWLSFYQKNLSYTTQFGEIKEIGLPDGSNVILNANSTLTFNPATLESTVRKVHLEGEAYFHVVRKNLKAPVKFIVLTENGEIEVLGTQFNVNSRHGKTSVVLNSGKVKFNAEENQNTMLEPGDMVEYSKDSKALTMQKVDPETHSSWRNHKLKFDDTSLLELTRILEDNYGLKVVIENQDLLQEKITGEISAKNVDILLQAVSKLFNIQVNQTGKTVYFN